LKFFRQGLNEEDQERLAAYQTVAASATSDHPPRCVICRDVTSFPSFIGYAQGVLKKSFGLAVFVICRPCSSAAESE
jgi:hypothetical protein